MPKPLQFLLIAGEPSGELLAAELVESLRTRLRMRGAPTPRFLGAGGPDLEAAGVERRIDLSRFAIVGLSDVLRNLLRLRRLLHDTVDLVLQERPDFVICVDYGGFNRRLAAAIRARQPADWRPFIVQYVSPQVWASRAGRARTLARDLDLLVSILPIEKAWYGARYPGFRVEFVGHPIVDRHPTAALPIPAPASASASAPASVLTPMPNPEAEPGPLRVLLLPGSRSSEIARHWPVMVAAAERLGALPNVRWLAIFPAESRRQQALNLASGTSLGLQTQVGGLSEQLQQTTLAIASTGTVTLECALWRVPTIAIYKTSWSTAQIARRIIQVPYLAMPNLLANATIVPELIQTDATADRIAAEAARLLSDPAARQAMRDRLGEVVRSLGPPGASDRAADAILSLYSPPTART